MASASRSNCLRDRSSVALMRNSFTATGVPSSARAAKTTADPPEPTTTPSPIPAIPNCTTMRAYVGSKTVRTANANIDTRRAESWQWKIPVGGSQLLVQSCPGTAQSVLGYDDCRFTLLGQSPAHRLWVGGYRRQPRNETHHRDGVTPSGTGRFKSMKPFSIEVSQLLALSYTPTSSQPAEPAAASTSVILAAVSNMPTFTTAYCHRCAPSIGSDNAAHRSATSDAGGRRRRRRPQSRPRHG